MPERQDQRAVQDTQKTVRLVGIYKRSLTLTEASELVGLTVGEDSNFDVEEELIGRSSQYGHLCVLCNTLPEKLTFVEYWTLQRLRTKMMKILPIRKMKATPQMTRTRSVSRRPETSRWPSRIDHYENTFKQSMLTRMDSGPPHALVILPFSR